MDVLTVDGKSYIKASVLARELGYTADYIGQLCRADKVDAQLVGRSWYVEKTSIKSHKSTRYRSTQVKTHKAIEAHVEVHNKERAHAVPIHGVRSIVSPVTSKPKDSAHFYIHNSLKPSPRYTPDDADLLPAVNPLKKKTGTLHVDLADATAVHIVSKSEEYVFDTPALPEIKFKGALTLSEYDEKEVLVPEGGVLLHPKEVEQLKSHAKAQKFSEVREDLASEVREVENENGSASFEIPVESLTEEVFVAVPTAIETKPLSRSYNFSILISTVTAVVVVAVFLSLESHVFISGSTSISTYIFEFENLLASVHQSVAYLQ